MVGRVRNEKNCCGLGGLKVVEWSGFAYVMAFMELGKQSVSNGKASDLFTDVMGVTRIAAIALG